MRQGRRDAASKRPSGSYSHRTCSGRGQVGAEGRLHVVLALEPGEVEGHASVRKRPQPVPRPVGPADDAVVVTCFGPDAVDAHVEAGVALRYALSSGCTR